MTQFFEGRSTDILTVGGRLNLIAARGGAGCPKPYLLPLLVRQLSQPIIAANLRGAPEMQSLSAVAPMKADTTTATPITSTSLVSSIPEQTAKAPVSRQRRNCMHGKFRPYCKDCKGSMLCVHLRHKNRCGICKCSGMAIGSRATIAAILP